MSSNTANNDPQIVLRGKLKSTDKSDIIVFKLRLALFELVFIVTVPPEGEDTAPVYVKHRIRRPEKLGFSTEVTRVRKKEFLETAEDIGPLDSGLLAESSLEDDEGLGDGSLLPFDEEDARLSEQ